MKLIISQKVHLQRKGSVVSLCGQVPWTKPVEFREGEGFEITCKRCQKQLEKAK
ncbi:hypothetical protein V7124_19615 [Neobacillus niacini]